MKTWLALAALLLACDDPTMIVVDDAYPAGTNVDQVWWSETLVPDVIGPGGESPAYRTVPADDYAYAVLDRDGALLVVRSKTPLSATRGDTLHVIVSQDTFDGDCAAGTPLSQAVADEITQSIFPGEFAGAVYDAATCKTARPSGPDAGAD